MNCAKIKKFFHTPLSPTFFRRENYYGAPGISTTIIESNNIENIKIDSIKLEDIKIEIYMYIPPSHNIKTYLSLIFNLEGTMLPLKRLFWNCTQAKSFQKEACLKDKFCFDGFPSKSRHKKGIQNEARKIR